MYEKVSAYKAIKAIKNQAPTFYSFFRNLRMSNTITDVIFIKQADNTEPIVLTSHSETPPFDYYRWQKEGNAYFPEFVKDYNLQLSDLILINSETKPKI